MTPSSDNPGIVTATDIEALRKSYRMLNDEQIIDPDFFADDFVLEQTETLLDTRGTFHGVAGLEASFRELQEGFGDVRFEPIDFDVRDDWVIISIRFSAAVRGIRQETRITHIWQMRDGLATRMRVVGTGGDVEAALAELRARV